MPVGGSRFERLAIGVALDQSALRESY